MRRAVENRRLTARLVLEEILPTGRRDPAWAAQWAAACQQPGVVDERRQRGVVDAVGVLIGITGEYIATRPGSSGTSPELAWIELKR